MDRSRMDDFVANAALLAAHLTQQCEKAVAKQQAAALDLQQSADALGEGVAAGKLELEQHARGAIREALARELADASRSLEDTVDRLQQLGERLRIEQSSAGLRMRVLEWKSIASLAVAAAVLVGGSAYAARHNLQRAERAQVRADVLEALRHVAITSCDGRPCVKLEDGLQRWTKNDEYVLVDAGASVEAAGR
ncbi:hypothetical protein FQY83_10810 [Luteimonas marina]|uniref:Relaxation protein n=1 Tax=Luteimonas marina TaxID=488485 RepID=A0A5C5U3R8_9GAMM|nr:hypothetical protein [Luteimonas marina]TWT20222.1 hypothetical protein FQY83_10810 [Luteimonas marina]